MNDETNTPAPEEPPSGAAEPDMSLPTEPAPTADPEQFAAPEPAVASAPEPAPAVAYEPEPFAATPTYPTSPAASASLPAPGPAPKRGVSVGGAIGIAFVMALLFGGLAGGAAGFAGSWLTTHGNGSSDSPSSITVVPSETDEPIVAAAAAALPSVVNIDVTGATVTDDSGTLPEDHPQVPISGNGSGIAWKSAEDGGTYILTNAHVLENVTDVVVTDNDRERYTAEVVGTDADTDIAVIRIDAELPLLEVADSDELTVGQTTVAIGSPYGLSQSVSSGVISAVGRSLPDSISSQEGVYPLVDVIQTDAAINPGNSGGALVDRAGRLIGVNAAIYSDSGSSGGVGFAIPSNTAVAIAEQLVEDGSADHPFLGVLGRDVDALLATEEDLPVEEGAYVVDVTPGTNAEKADLQTGDVIVQLDDDAIRSMDDLILQVRRHQIGDIVTITLYRNGERMEVEMEVGTKPQNLDTTSSETPTETP